MATLTSKSRLTPAEKSRAPLAEEWPISLVEFEQHFDESERLNKGIREAPGGLDYAN